MKKIIMGFLLFGLTISLAACNSSRDKTGTASSIKETSTVVSIEDSSSEGDKRMVTIEKDLESKGVEIEYYRGYLTLTREKGIDYDYFELIFKFESGDLFEITLQLKGNIDGEKKDILYYEVSKGRIVEQSYRNTDIVKIAEVLESIGYSDKDLLEFAQWYYDNNK